MHRIDHPTLSADENGPGKDGFTEGAPGTVAATVVTDDWLNDVQEEIANTVEDAGNILVKNTQDQLLDAIKKYVVSACAGHWEKNSLAAFAGNVNAVAYGNGYFVAVGDGGNLEYSIDGINWTANDQGASDLNGVFYGNGYWTAVGAGGTLYYTTDPTGAWTANNQGSSAFYTIHYANGYWVAAGQSGTLYYKATDPAGSWTSNTQGSLNLNTVYYGNGYWVAAGQSGTLLYKATNPTGSWTSNTQGTALLNTVRYGNGYWMVVGQSGVFLYHAANPTGTWSSNSPNGGGSALYGLVIWCGCIIVVGLDDTPYLTKSPDGTWVITENTGDSYRSACYGNGRVLLGTDNAEISTSLQFAFDV